MLQVVITALQLLFQVGQQCRHAGGVVLADVVGQVNDAAPQQPGPNAVGNATGEPRVFWRNEPVGEDLARILVGRHLELGPVRHRDGGG